MPDPLIETISSEEPTPVGPQPRAPRAMGAGSRATAMAAALSLVLAGGVATAAYRAFRSSSDPTTLIPASAFAVATLDLSLPDGQDSALRAFADHFPGSPTRTGDGSAVDRLFRAALRSSRDPHLDYDKDIRPWLGDHVAVAGWLDDGDKAHAEYLVEVTDESAARATIRKLDATSPDDPGVVFADGYAVLANTQTEARDAVAAARTSALAGNAQFTGDTGRLPGDEAFRGWLDGPRLKTALGSILGPLAGGMLGSGGALGGTGLFGVNAASAFKGRTAAGVRVADNYAQLDIYQFGGDAPQQSASSRLTQLPGGTIAALDIGDPGPVVDAVTSLVKQFTDFGGEVTSCTATSGGGPEDCTSSPAPTPPDPLAEFTKATGLTLPDDVKTLLGDASVVSYGGLQIGGLPQVAIRSHPANLAAARDVAQRFADRVSQETGFQVVVDTAGDDLILATTADYAKAVGETGTLGQQAQASTALGDVPSEVAVAGYVDLSRIWPIAGSFIPEGAKHLKAIGFWAAVDGGAQHSQLRVVVG